MQNDPTTKRRFVRLDAQIMVDAETGTPEGIYYDYDDKTHLAGTNHWFTSHGVEVNLRTPEGIYGPEYKPPTPEQKRARFLLVQGEGDRADSSEKPL